MALKFTGRRWHDEQTGTITFPAWVGNVRLPCRITDEALIFLFGAVATPSGLVEAFDKHCAVIQAAAGWKHEAAPDGPQLILVSTDFPDRAPAAPPEPKTLDSTEVVRRMDRFRRAFHGGNAVAAAAVATASEAGETQAETTEDASVVEDEPAA